MSLPGDVSVDRIRLRKDRRERLRREHGLPKVIRVNQRSQFLEELDVWVYLKRHRIEGLRVCYTSAQESAFFSGVPSIRAPDRRPRHEQLNFRFGHAVRASGLVGLNACRPTSALGSCPNGLNNDVGSVDISVSSR
jgi:hypothetical protein